jgi:dipeptidase E
MNVLLASTSTLFGGKYLEYIKQEISELFSGIDEIIFVPFARPSGISHEDYTEIARNFFAQINIKVKGCTNLKIKLAINSAKGYFTGGGNTFLW